MKSRSLITALSLLIGMGCCLMATSLCATTITWSAPVPFNGLSAAQILAKSNNTPGAIVGAVGFGIEEPAIVTIATNFPPVVFGTFADPTVASVGSTNGISYGTGSYPATTTNTTGNTILDSVLNNFVDNSKTLTITLINLIPGDTYSVQLFAVDDRSASTSNTVSFQNPTNAANSSSTFSVGSNAYVVGTFTVPTNGTGALTNFTIQQNLSSPSGILNALVVRAVSFTPSINVTFQPTNNNLDVGDTAVFSALATGPAPLLPHWEYGPSGGPYTNLVDNGHYSGSGTYNLTISNVAVADASNVYLLNLSTVTNSGTNIVTSSATSRPALLSVFGNSGVTNSVAAGGNINAAIESVYNSGGGTVLLAPGIYNGSVLMYPHVTLKGAGTNTLLVGGTLTQAYGGASYWSVEDLVIDGQVPATYQWQGGADNAGVNAGTEGDYDTYDLSFKNVEIKNTAIGMRLVAVNGCYLTGCKVHDSGLGFSHDIYFVGCLNVNMSNCISDWSQANLSRSGDGVHLDFIGSTAYYVFQQCEFSDNNGYGILCQSYSNSFPNITVSGCLVQYDGLENQTNDGMWITANGTIETTRSEYNIGYGLDTIYGGDASANYFLTVGNQSNGVRPGTSTSHWLNGLTPNVYLAQQAEGVTGPGNTADWTTNFGGNNAGAVDFNANHSVNGAITWPNVSAPAAGSYPLDFVYANGSSDTLAMPLSVNGSYVGSVLFPPTGGWSVYATSSITANLTSSNNTVALEVLSPGLGSPEISELEVNAATPAAPFALTGLTWAVNTNAPRTDVSTWISLSWNALPGATYYNIERNGCYLATGVSGTSYTDEHVLGNDTSCTYYVAPVNAGGTGAGASVAAVSITAFPTSLTATGGMSSITLSYAATTDAKFYTIYRATASGGPYKKVATTTATTYSDFNVVYGTTYYYVVTACDGLSQSLDSPQASASLYKPYSGPAELIDVDLGSSATQSGAAVLGSSGDEWNAVSSSTSTVFNSAGSTLSGVGLSLSDYGVYTDSGGTAMDAATTPLMEDYAFGYTAGTATVTVSLTGLTQYRGASFTLVVYAAGDNSGQGATLRLTGATGGNSANSLSTSAASRKISAGNGVAYQTFTGTMNNGTLTLTAAELSGQSFTVINGFQLYLTAP